MISINDISKRHSSGQNDIVENNQAFIGVFENSLKKSLAVYVKKMEKITSALQLVTGVMEGNAVLSDMLQGQSLALLSATYTTLSRNNSISSVELSGIFTRVEELVSLVNVGATARFISSMNANIILGELEKLNKLIAVDISELSVKEKSFGAKSSISSQTKISPDMLADDHFDELLKRHESKRHQNDIKTTLLAQNDTLNDIQKIKTTFQNDISKPVLQTNERIDRKQEIISLIQSRRVTTINDIRSEIKGCSDKTLQREIAELVSMGVIKREGNKRWATYKAV